MIFRSRSTTIDPPLPDVVIDQSTGKVIPQNNDDQNQRAALRLKIIASVEDRRAGSTREYMFAAQALLAHYYAMTGADYLLARLCPTTGRSLPPNWHTQFSLPFPPLAKSMGFAPQQSNHNAYVAGASPVYDEQAPLITREETKLEGSLRTSYTSEAGVRWPFP